MKPSIFSKPIRYNYQKLFVDGYHYITVKGKSYSLKISERSLIEGISKTINFPKYYARMAALRQVERKNRPLCEMKDGYGFYNYSALPELDLALKACDEKIKVYFSYKDSPKSVAGVKDLSQYEYEMRKTLKDPLKHVPYMYDPVAAEALLKPFLRPEMYLPAAHYIGAMPIIAGVRILYSPNDDAPSLLNAQMFHVDPEGSRQVKVFIAIDEVGPENSPLTFLSESDSVKITSSPEPEFGSKRVTDKSLLGRIPRERWISHEGPRGSTLFIDTSRCLHQGSRPNKKPRFLLMAQYLDPFSSMFPVWGAQNWIRKRVPAFSTQDPSEQYLLAQRWGRASNAG